MFKTGSDLCGQTRVGRRSILVEQGRRRSVQASGLNRASVFYVHCLFTIRKADVRGRTFSTSLPVIAEDRTLPRTRSGN